MIVELIDFELTATESGITGET